MTLRGHTCKPTFHHNSVKNPTLISRSVSESEFKLVFLNIRYHHKPVHSHTQNER